MSELKCFYQCCRCKFSHPGGVKTPETVEMIPGERKNEWVFVCVPECKPGPTN